MATKTDNSEPALDAKIELRRRVLEQVKPARVFDAFAGLGTMYDRAWSSAAAYVGCDEREWSATEKHRRFVADNRLVLRAIDLGAFNVFDLDAYGSPWEQALIIATRRAWTAGELGALVLTDGSDMALRYGRQVRAITKLAPDVPTPAPGDKQGAFVQRAALRGWLRRSRVRPLHIWHAEGTALSGVGSQTMRYSAVVFEGAAS